MMLPGYEGKRYYVNALSGFSLVANTIPATVFSVHDAYYSCRMLARFPKFGTGDSRGDAFQRRAALRLAAELNAEHDAWVAAG